MATVAIHTANERAQQHPPNTHFRQSVMHTHTHYGHPQRRLIVLHVCRHGRYKGGGALQLPLHIQGGQLDSRQLNERIRHIINTFVVLKFAPVGNCGVLFSMYCSYPNLKSVRELTYKRGFGKVDRRRTALSDNAVIEQVRAGQGGHPTVLEQLSKCASHWLSLAMRLGIIIYLGLGFGIYRPMAYETLMLGDWIRQINVTSFQASYILLFMNFLKLLQDRSGTLTVFSVGLSQLCVFSRYSIVQF